MSESTFFILLGISVFLFWTGGLIGLVQAFKESGTWGVLYLFVPFANLVFIIKFWSARKWVKRAGYLILAGLTMLLVLNAAVPDSL